jgi:hypothetical protein
MKVEVRKWVLLGRGEQCDLEEPLEFCVTNAEVCNSIHKF